MDSKDVLELAGMFGELIGTLSIAYAAIAVHHRVKNEHKIDEAVFMEMNREMRIAFFGVAAILLGFTAQALAKFAL